MDSIKEIHLFIIWEKARYCESEILKFLKKEFRVLAKYKGTWGKKYFSRNLTRFYGEKLPEGSFKERHCGVGEFLVIIIEDLSPIYNYRQTSKGLEWVNTSVFDAKTLFRHWTGGGHKIHATNDLAETRHDLSLLLGLQSEQYFNAKKYLPVDRTQELPDFAGAQTWKNIKELFYVLNHTIDYVVLRNFECLPDHFTMKDHGDIDLLVNNIEATTYVTNASSVYSQSSRVLKKVSINNEDILFDFRYIGDGYMDSCWQKNILNEKILYNNYFYIPNNNNYFYSLLYHALIHKKRMCTDYRKKLSLLSKEIPINKKYSNRQEHQKYCLDIFMECNKYKYTIPNDISVYYNRKKSKLLRVYRILLTLSIIIKNHIGSNFKPKSIYRKSKEFILINASFKK